MPTAEELLRTRIAAVATALGHHFHEPRWLTQACTHASRCGAQASAADKRRDANERLEFLGDAVLGAAVCQILFQRFPDLDEGPLSRLKSTVVSRATLARAIEPTGLLTHCEVGQQMQGVWPDSVKANFAEAILGAIYLDGGWTPLVSAVERLLGERITDPTSGDEDQRMRLQVWCLEHHKQLPVYSSERCGGSDHEPLFRTTVSIAQQQACGEGTSRRRADAAAAANLLALLHNPPNNVS